MLTQPADAFGQLAHEVFQAYVRSAVIIDDAWEDFPSTVKLPADQPFRGPGSKLSEEDFGADVAAPMSGLEVPVLARTSVVPGADALLLRGIRDNLVGGGVITCGFRYQGPIDRSAARRLAAGADIVVLDWHLAGPDSSEALEVLRGLRERGGLHFVCIFSGQARPHEIRQELVEALSPGSEEARRVSASTLAGADLRLGNLVISIRVKPGLEAGGGPEAVVPESFLVEVLSGLSTAYGGLVQLAMLEMTSRHRLHLPRILERADPSMDTAVLFEAGLAASPVGAGGAFLSVLVDEWRAHLELEQASLKVLGHSGLRAFGERLGAGLQGPVSSHLEESLRLVGVAESRAKKFSESPPAELQEWFRGGCRGPVPAAGGREWAKGEKVTVAWAVLRAFEGRGREQFQELVEPLLLLDSFFHQQMEQPGRLTQGTVVGLKHGDSTRYLICVTPLCDADRPAEKLDHIFSFLPARQLQPSRLLSKEPDRAGAHCVIRDGDRIECLEILLKQRLALRVYEREFDKDGFLQAHDPFLGSSFLGGSPEPKEVVGLQLRRVGQLRLEHALSFASAAASDSSRVGVNSVELIRTQVRGGGQ